MARVTVEDCILIVPNRFELVMLAAQRAKQIAAGNPLTIPRDNDKDAVVALREVAEKTVDIGTLEADVIQGFCKKQQHERFEREATSFKDNEETKTKQLTDEISQAFEEARQHVPVIPPDQDAEGGGISFAEENIDVKD